MIRIDTAADLSDLFGGQTHFEVAVTIDGPEGFDILGAGHTVAEAVSDARRTLRIWRGEHRCDDDCVQGSGLNADGDCDVCGATGGECPVCGGARYHEPGCAESDDHEGTAHETRTVG